MPQPTTLARFEVGVVDRHDQPHEDVIAALAAVEVGLAVLADVVRRLYPHLEIQVNGEDGTETPDQMYAELARSAAVARAGRVV